MKSKSGSRQIAGPQSAPGFARSTGKPRDGQLACSQPRAPSSGQTKMPADQGGRAEGGSGKKY